jgi:hypothetical protein
MPSRSLDFGEDAEMSLADALEALGVRLAAPNDGWDIAIDLDGGGQSLQLSVCALAQASPARVRKRLAAVGSGATGGVNVLVADAIPKESRDLLNAAGWGWYDRRGHLRLVGPGLHLDTESRPTIRRNTHNPVLGTPSGIAVAYELLRSPREKLPVRATANRLHVHASSVSRALQRLCDESLVDGRGLPLVPELFWALADTWPRQPIGLRRSPRTDDTVTKTWVECGTRAAIEWGVPLVASDATPPEFMLPSRPAEREAVQRYGRPAAAVAAAAFVSFMPVVTVLLDAIARTGSWPIAPPLAIALELAADRTRGSEALEAWTPPQPYQRVW